MIPLKSNFTKVNFVLTPIVQTVGNLKQVIANYCAKHPKSTKFTHDLKVLGNYSDVMLTKDIEEFKKKIPNFRFSMDSFTDKEIGTIFVNLWRGARTFLDMEMKDNQTLEDLYQIIREGKPIEDIRKGNRHQTMGLYLDKMNHIYFSCGMPHYDTRYDRKLGRGKIQGVGIPLNDSYINNFKGRDHGPWLESLYKRGSMYLIRVDKSYNEDLIKSFQPFTGHAERMLISQDLYDYMYAVHRIMMIRKYCRNDMVLVEYREILDNFEGCKELLHVEEDLWDYIRKFKWTDPKQISPKAQWQAYVQNNFTVGPSPELKKILDSIATIKPFGRVYMADGRQNLTKAEKRELYAGKFNYDIVSSHLCGMKTTLENIMMMFQYTDRLESYNIVYELLERYKKLMAVPKEEIAKEHDFTRDQIKKIFYAVAYGANPKVGTSDIYKELRLDPQYKYTKTKDLMKRVNAIPQVEVLEEAKETIHHCMIMIFDYSIAKNKFLVDYLKDHENFDQIAEVCKGNPKDWSEDQWAAWALHKLDPTLLGCYDPKEIKNFAKLLDQYDNFNTRTIGVFPYVNGITNEKWVAIKIADLMEYFARKRELAAKRGETYTRTLSRREVFAKGVAYLNQGMESRFILTIAGLCQKTGIKTLSHEHDGLITDKPIPDTIISQAKFFTDLRNYDLKEEAL